MQYIEGLCGTPYPVHEETGLPIFNDGRPLQFRPKAKDIQALDIEGGKRHSTFLRKIFVDTDTKQTKTIQEVLQFASQEFQIINDLGARVVDHLFGLYQLNRHFFSERELNVPRFYTMAAEVAIVDVAQVSIDAQKVAEAYKSSSWGLVDAISRRSQFVTGVSRLTPEATSVELNFVDLDLYMRGGSLWDEVKYKSGVFYDVE